LRGMNASSEERLSWTQRLSRLLSRIGEAGQRKSPLRRALRDRTPEAA
jgi:hypothetical protein